MPHDRKLVLYQEGVDEDVECMKHIHICAMPVIYLETLVNAPPEVCFDLARNIDVHAMSTSSTKERAVAGRTSGLITKGECPPFWGKTISYRAHL
jgi:hypothetical protein